MPKHLYTIPTGTVLPDPTGMPEGSPFVLEGADGTDEFFTLRSGVYKLATGGVSFGRFLPIDPLATATVFDAQRTPSPAGGNVIMLGNPATFAPVAPIAPLYAGDHDIPAVNVAWHLPVAAPSQVDFIGSGYALSFNFPATTQPTRVDVVYRPPLTGQTAGATRLVASGNPFPATDWRNVPGQYPLDAAPGNTDDSEDKEPLFVGGEALQGWQTASFVLPAGATHLYLGQVTNPAYVPTDPAGGGYDARNEAFAVAYLRLTPLKDGKPGQLFIQQADSSVWLFDSSVDPLATTAGVGWYPIEKPVLESYSTQYAPFQGDFVGDTRFSKPEDLSGRRLGLAASTSLAVDFFGKIPAGTAAAATICLTANPQQTAPPAYNAGDHTKFGLPAMVPLGAGHINGVKAVQVMASLSENAPSGSLTIDVAKVTAGSWVQFDPLHNSLVVASGSATGQAAVAAYSEYATGKDLFPGERLTAFATTGAGWSDAVNDVYVKVTVYLGPELT